MDQTTKSRWQVRGAALIIFLLGCAAGALAFNVYRTWSGGAGQMSRQDRFEQMSERLKLDGEKKTEVQHIFDDTRSQLQTLRKESDLRVKEIRQQADERLQKVFTPEQWQQFQQMRDEWHRRDPRVSASPGESPSNSPPPVKEQ
jgi:Spy/CpxP family protein refolding chaperone